MEKEEILEKSRRENRNQNIFEKEILKEGNSAAVFTIFILATIFFIVQIFTGGGINYGLYALVFSGNMATFWVKWFRLKHKHELAMAILYTIFVLALSASHIYNLAVGTIGGAF